MWDSKSSGFTLVELLVVMILIGLFSSLIFISVGSGILKSEEKKFVQNFLQVLNQARAASLGRGEAIRFIIDGNERKFYINNSKQHDIPEEVQVEGEGIAEFDSDKFGVIFFPDASSSGGEIDLRLGSGATERIIISRLMGIITIQREE